MSDKTCAVCAKPVADDDVLGFQSEGGEPWLEDDGTPVELPHCGGCWCVDQVRDSLIEWARKEGLKYQSLDPAWDEPEEDTDELVLPPRRTPLEITRYEARGSRMLQSEDHDAERTWRIWVKRMGSERTYVTACASLNVDGDFLPPREWEADGENDLEALGLLCELVFESLVAKAFVPDVEAVEQLDFLIEEW